MSVRGLTGASDIDPERQNLFDSGRSNGMDLEATFGTTAPVIGMVHLPALPGAPNCERGIEAIRNRAVADAEALEAGGVDGLIVENYGDVPFYPDSVPAHTVASMTRVAADVADATELPIGINVLRNDGEAALSVAAAVDAAFVRINVHTGARVTDQGIVEGTAHETLRLRDRLDADVAVFADIDVKHSAALSDGQSIESSLKDTVERGLADAVIVSGPGTGAAIEGGSLAAALEARAERSEVPILIGSGVDAGSVGRLLGRADGVIVGTALKRDGETTAPVETSRVANLVDHADSARYG